MSTSLRAYYRAMHLLGARYLAVINGVPLFFNDVSTTVEAVLDNGASYLGSVHADGTLKREIL